LPDGIMGIKELAVDKLDPYRGESSRIISAINKITESLTASWWDTRSTLGSKHGHKVFSREKDAVQKLEQAAEEDNLSPEALATGLEVIADLVGADRRFAVDALDLSLETPTLNPKRQKMVAKLQQDAQQQIDEGDSHRDQIPVSDEDEDDEDHEDEGHWSNAIDHYRKAWEKAVAALDEQADPADGIDDDDDEEDEGNGNE
jgi:hypothetical protein